MENKLSYEDRIKELNELILKLQDENLPFEDSLVLYKKAIALTDALKKELDEAIASVSLIDQNNNKEDF